MDRKVAFFDVPWEAKHGYARAVRVGNLVDVGITTAAASDGTLLYPGDVYMQTKECLRIIGDALAEVGASYADVFKVRMYLEDISRWEEAARAHADIFKDTTTDRPTAGLEPKEDRYARPSRCAASTYSPSLRRSGKTDALKI